MSGRFHSSSIILLLLLFISCSNKERNAETSATNFGNIRSIISNGDTIRFAYNSSDRISSCSYRCENSNIDYTNLRIYYSKNKIIIKGILCDGEARQEYKLDSLNRAESCITKWTNGIAQADLATSEFEYNLNGFLIETRTKFYYNNQFIRENTTRFNISNNNIIEIYDDSEGSRSLINYGIEDNKSNLRIEREFWNSELFIAGLYANILGKPSSKLPISASRYSRQDAKVRFDYKYDDYSFDTLGYCKGWVLARYFASTQSSDSQTILVTYYLE